MDPRRRSVCDHCYRSSQRRAPDGKPRQNCCCAPSAVSNPNPMENFFLLLLRFLLLFPFGAGSGLLLNVGKALDEGALWMLRLGMLLSHFPLGAHEALRAYSADDAHCCGIR